MIYGTDVKQLPQRRLYIVQTTLGQFRRNRWHLIPAPHMQSSNTLATQNYLNYNKLLNLNLSSLHQSCYLPIITKLQIKAHCQYKQYKR